jgi:transposase-like protein
LAELLARRLEEKDILVVNIDGLHFGEYCVLGAVGVDAEGHKIVLGIHEGATENAAACKDLLEDLVGRGLDRKRKRLFVIDGSKALRSAINAVFGSQTPVQRCRQHKLRNVLERLPKEQQKQTGGLMIQDYAYVSVKSLPKGRLVVAQGQAKKCKALIFWERVGHKHFSKLSL